MRVSVLLAAFVGLVGSPVQQEPYRLPQRLARMTPEQFEHSVSVKDDDLETMATITTQPGFQEKHGIFGIVWSDSFLRTFVNKQTGAARYQLYEHILNAVYKWNNYRLANYETPDGPKSVSVLKLGRTLDCATSSTTRRCPHYEDVAVPMDEALLKAIAARYQPGGQAAWSFRFKAQSGVEYDDGMSVAEVAGMLAAVAAYRRAHHLPGG